MSYCVNCGVELEPSLKICPLCQTPVNNPKQIPLPSDYKAPFPSESGMVEEVSHKDIRILLSVMLSTTALACLLLNFFIYNSLLWSLPICGISILLWVLLIPFMFPGKVPLWLQLFLDLGGVVLLLSSILCITESSIWFWHLMLPLAFIIFLQAELVAFGVRHLPFSFLIGTLYLNLSAAVICLAINALVSYYRTDHVHITWSAIVLTVCVILSAAQIAVLSRTRLRNIVRKRLHF
ncbi:MAG: hypothetical protein PHE06_05935 [Lachnospiraceae bacterium]|nr:hypothetical protein [Lachnospiraceae bacterium]